MSKFVEKFQVVQAIVPIDFSSGDNVGDYVNMANYTSCVFIVSTDVGTAGDDIVIDATQATSAAGAGDKALTKITRIDHKVGATAISAVGTFTTVTQTAAASYDSVAIDEAENQALLIVEVMAADLDTNNGFDFLKFDVADTGTNAGHMGSAIYILTGARYPQATLTSAIA